MHQWKMVKYDNEAHKRTYQIYFEDRQGQKWYLGDSFYYAEAASMVDLLSSPEVRSALTEYMDSVSANSMDFNAYKNAFAIVSPILSSICTKHDVNWIRSAINLDTIKGALEIERKADNV